MRLIRLEFQGVGSFADRMEIDFATLGGAGLFLIEGPTGSGKSTILDAIVFALYGTPAGTGSDPGRLDSHLRHGDCQPFVQLDFACGDAVYRIRRTPRHERDKRRGTGQRVDEGGVSLERLSPDPEGISHKAREVGDWVVDHIGLTKQQFVSTIVLAQGEFSTFLNAETKQRTPILEKIFGTQFYQQVEQQLVDMRKDALRRRTQADVAFEGVVNRCLGLLSLPPAEDPVGAIDAEIGRLGKDLAQARGRLERCETALRAAEDQLTAARATQEAQVCKQKALVTLQHLQSRRAQVDALRSVLSSHDRAWPAQAALEAWDQAEQQRTSARSEARDAVAALAAVGESRADSARLTEVTRLLGGLAGAAAVEQSLPTLRAAVDTASTEHEQLTARVEALITECDGIADDVAEAQKTAVRPDTEDAELLELMADRVRVDQQVRAAEDVAELAKQAVAAQQSLDAARTSRERAEQRLHRAQQAEQRNVAASLAATLVDGQPCLVCGALEHPAPAEPTRQSVAVAELEQNVAARLLEESSAKTLLDGLRGQILGRRAPAPEASATVAERLTVIEARIAVLQAAKDVALAAARRVEECRRVQADRQARLQQARLDEQQARSQVATAAEGLQRALAEVERARDVYPSVAERVEALTGLSQALSRAIEAEVAASAADTMAAQATSTLDSTLARLDLPDAATARAALLDAAVAEAYRQEIQGFDTEVMEVEAELRDLADVDVDADAGVAAAADAVADRRDEHAEQERLVGRLQHTHAEALPLRDEITGAQAECALVHEQTAGVIHMADLATASRGEVVHRVKLSAFVLMRRFESVVEAANDRLDAISEGRYQLRVQHTGLDNRGQAGLDLVVEDLRTERCRPTTSLSGGESFYVSLALALGLADVVRSESGGVVLGTLFIDEGFGSLDAEVLEEVIDMLEQVRAGEDRVIGLVSHVDVLKQRIDPRISVRRDPQRSGVSTLEVHV